MVQNLEKNLNNELYQDKFKLVFKEIPSIELLCTGANIPGVAGAGLEVPNAFNKIFVPGNKLQYDDLTLTFKVDENLETYKELFNWILALYHPQSYEQFKQYQAETRLPKIGKGYNYGFDASLITLSNAMNFNVEVNFIHLFPKQLSPIDFNLSSSTNDDHVMATATFQFDYFYFK